MRDERRINSTNFNKFHQIFIKKIKQKDTCALTLHMIFLNYLHVCPISIQLIFYGSIPLYNCIQKIWQYNYKPVLIITSVREHTCSE